MGQNESETGAKITQKSKSANMTNFDSIGLSIKNVNKNAKKLMSVQSYEILKFASLLKSLNTSKLRYYYLHHNSILIKNGQNDKYRQETFF